VIASLALPLAAVPQEAAAQEAAAQGGAAAPALTPPPVEPNPPGPASSSGVDVAKDWDPRDIVLARPSDKPWRISGSAQYRSLLVQDEDPANDRYMLYRLQGSYFPLRWLSVFARFGVNQRFVSVQGESGVRMDDTALGANAEQDVSLEPLGWRRNLALSHTLSLYLPTSFASQEQDLYFALDWSTRARVRLVDELYAGLRGSLQYRFNEYAEQAGPGGGALPRFVVTLQPFVEYSPLVSKRFGKLTVGADVVGDETIYYPSRDPASIPADELPPGTLASSNGSISESGTSDSFVTPHYGYSLYAIYVPPIPYLSFSLALEQAGNVVRYGEPRLYFIHRDQTEIALRVVASY
jgi:hypothetical protein